MKRFRREKNQIHPLDNKRYNDDLQLEIDTIE
jgi:hypothetical protein